MTDVVALIDLFHLGRAHVIASYLLPGSRHAVVDCGPSVCVDALEAGLAEHGLRLDDVDDLLLTHIHPDHAGGAGALARRNSRLQVHVSEIGAPHLVDPSRLERSARRLYADDFDRLFGEIIPVPAANVHVFGRQIAGLEVFPTPGHASHHVSFLGEDGACYAGDAVGCLIPPGSFLYPAAAPPEIDLVAWEASFESIEARAPSSLRLPHFGEVADALGHLRRMRARLEEWASWVEAGLSEEEFVARAEGELQAEAGPTVDQYRQLPGFDLTYAGIRRYFDKLAPN